MTWSVKSDFEEQIGICTIKVIQKMTRFKVSMNFAGMKQVFVTLCLVICSYIRVYVFDACSAENIIANCLAIPKFTGHLTINNKKLQLSVV